MKNIGRGANIKKGKLLHFCTAPRPCELRERWKNGHYIKTNIDNAFYLHDPSAGFDMPGRVKRVLAGLAMYGRLDTFMVFNGTNGRNVGFGVCFAPAFCLYMGKVKENE